MRKGACHEHHLKTHNEAVTKNPISQAHQTKVFQATTKPEEPVQRIAHPRVSRPARVHLPAVRDVDKAFAQRVRHVVIKAVEELNEANQRTICAQLRALPSSSHQLVILFHCRGEQVQSTLVFRSADCRPSIIISSVRM